MGLGQLEPVSKKPLKGSGCDWELLGYCDDGSAFRIEVLRDPRRPSSKGDLSKILRAALFQHSLLKSLLLVVSSV